MDWLIGLLLLVFGIVIGFFVGKYLFEPKQKAAEDEAQEKSEKQLMAEQANLHISETQIMLQKLQQQCQLINEQLSHYQAVVEETTQDKGNNKLEFYHQQASMHLKTQKKERSKQPSKADYQPLDYSEGSSGLFAGDKKKHSETSSS